MFSKRTITNQELQTYHEQGFLVIRNGLKDEGVAHVQNWADELAACPEEKDSHWIFKEKNLKSKLEDDQLLSRIEMIDGHHNGFRQLNLYLKQMVSDLFDEEPTLFKDKLNFKMPGGDGFKPHQDSQAGWDKYASEFITVMVTIDPATIDNGCLFIADGPHEKTLVRLWEPLTDADIATMNFKAYPTNPGDLIFFHSYIPHYSQCNMTENMRRLYFATFNKLSEGDFHQEYHDDKFENYPPDIYRETDKKYIFKV